MMPLPLRVGDDTPDALTALLTKASVRLAADPGLAVELPDGTYELRCPLPDGYRSRMNHYATQLAARIGNGGYVFEVSEKGAGISGGFIGSCIPISLYRIFLSAWLDATSVRQLELFA